MEANSELIEKYLRGLCSDEEREKVRRLKKNSKEFAEELQSESKVFATIKIGERESQRERLSKLGQELKKNPRIPSPTIIPFRQNIVVLNARVMRIAAIVLPLAILGVAWWFITTNNKGISNIELSDGYMAENLPADDFDTYVNRVRGENQENQLSVHLDSTLTKAETAYQAENCEELQETIDELLKMNEEDESLFLSLSSCYLTIGEPDNALNILGNFSESSLAQDRVLWYSARAYLQKQDTVAFVTTLCELYHSDWTLNNDIIPQMIKKVDPSSKQVCE